MTSPTAALGAILPGIAAAAAGHDRALPPERHWRDMQCARMHAPAADAAHLAAGRAALSA